MAPSKESQAQAALYRVISKAFTTAGDDLYLQRAAYDKVHTLASEATGVSYEDTAINSDVPAIWVRPEGASKQHVMLFMHGGGYSFGSPNGHRKMAAHLAKSCNVQALSVDYRMTPEVAYPVPLDDCVVAYKWLLDQGFKAEHIVTCGDSCGGGLSTTVPLAAIERGLPRPGAAVGLSPWYDLTLSGEAMESNKDNDALGTRPFVQGLAKKYLANGGDPKDPLVSALFASEEQLKELPPHWISAAGYDTLLSDATGFAEKAKNAGVEVVLDVHEEQQHVMEFLAGKALEAIESIKKIGAWVKEKIGS